MKETKQLRNLMEALNVPDDYWGSSKVMYVYDSSEAEVSELDPKDGDAMLRFNDKYGFDADSIYDFPVVRGVRVFEIHGRTVVVGSDLQAVAAEVESRSL